jgi:hypothetical protein
MAAVAVTLKKMILSVTKLTYPLRYDIFKSIIKQLDRSRHFKGIKNHERVTQITFASRKSKLE